MRNTNEQWPLPMNPVVKISQRAVIEATTHADSIAFIVEANQWQQDEIEPPGTDRGTSSDIRLLDVKAVALQSVSTAILRKPELVVGIAPQYRKVQLLTGMGCPVTQQ